MNLHLLAYMAVASNDRAQNLQQRYQHGMLDYLLLTVLETCLMILLHMLALHSIGMAERQL